MGRHAETAGGQDKLSPAANRALEVFERYDLGHLLDVRIVNYHNGGVTTVGDALACGPFAEGVAAMDAVLSAEQFGSTMEAYVASMAPPDEGQYSR